MQYIWENYHDNIQKLKFPIKQIYQLASKFLRPWDKTKRTYDDVYFNSEYTEAVAEKLYGMKGIVKYPPLDKAFNTSVITNDVHNYFIFVGRIVRYVREIDKIIHLFNATKEHLIIVGDGPDMGYAQSIAGPTIIFTGRVDDADEKKKLLEHARGLINISKESFGLVTAEALCAGVPVLGYNGGATAYLVNESNGYLVNEKDERSLMLGFDEFISMSFDREKISEDAQEKFFD